MHEEKALLSQHASGDSVDVELRVRRNEDVQFGHAGYTVLNGSHRLGLMRDQWGTHSRIWVRLVPEQRLIVTRINQITRSEESITA